jgi:hypothetical protein
MKPLCRTGSVFLDEMLQDGLSRIVLAELGIEQKGHPFKINGNVGLLTGQLQMLEAYETKGSDDVRDDFDHDGTTALITTSDSRGGGAHGLCF